jgi:YHS domain-containing protein
MAIAIDTALHVEVFDGERYYFSCDGCRDTFRREPAKFAAIHRTAIGGTSS